jgi:hypothetical protein
MRRINHKTRVGIVLALGLMGLSGGVHADAVLNCQLAKLKAEADRARCLTRQEGEKLKGNPFNFGACETAFDAAITAAGTACRYIDDGDGTVSDLNTLLIWEKKTVDGSVHDVDNRYTWSVEDGTAPKGTAFTDFLGRLNNCTSSDGSTVTGPFTGRCDWRLPTVAELQTIVNCAFSPCIDPIFGPTASPVATAAPYWTSTTNVTGFGAWIVVFSNGDVSPGGVKDDISQVRAVRGGR